MDYTIKILLNFHINIDTGHFTKQAEKKNSDANTSKQLYQYRSCVDSNRWIMFPNFPVANTSLLSDVNFIGIQNIGEQGHFGIWKVTIVAYNEIMESYALKKQAHIQVHIAEYY